MNHRQIIAEAWEFTQNNKKMIIWYAFFPSLLSTLAGIIYVLYQFYAFKSSMMFENWDRSFGYYIATTVIGVLKDNFSSIVPFIVAAIIIGILYILVPPLCEGSIIQLIARRKSGMNVRTRDGFRFGPLSFLPLFEYSWMTRTFNLVAVFSMVGTIGRNLGWDALYTFMPFIIIYAIVGTIITLLFTYTEFFIVIDDYKVFKAISKSCTLVITHLQETIMLSIMMLIISVRILVQLLFVLLIPAIISGSVYIFASTTVPFIGLVVGGVLGLIMLYIASYLTGTIHVFASTVWTFTFLKLTNTPQLNARGVVIENTDDEDEIDEMKDDLDKLKKAR
jgi:hypothetical protein